MIIWIRALFPRKMHRFIQWMVLSLGVDRYGNNLANLSILILIVNVHFRGCLALERQLKNVLSKGEEQNGNKKEKN